MQIIHQAHPSGPILYDDLYDLILNLLIHTHQTDPDPDLLSRAILVCRAFRDKLSDHLYHTISLCVPPSGAGAPFPNDAEGRCARLSAALLRHPHLAVRIRRLHLRDTSFPWSDPDPCPSSSVHVTKPPRVPVKNWMARSAALPSLLRLLRNAPGPGLWRLRVEGVGSAPLVCQYFPVGLCDVLVELMEGPGVEEVELVGLGDGFCVPHGRNITARIVVDRGEMGERGG